MGGNPSQVERFVYLRKRVEREFCSWQLVFGRYERFAARRRHSHQKIVCKKS